MCAVATTACTEKEQEWDATGIFETTDVIVSAKGAGEITELNVEEGTQVSAGEVIGKIDAAQLQLQKEQLRATKSATASRKLSQSAQVASLRQQIANLQRERQRFQELVRDNAATQKQVDDITYQISTLQKQIDATNEQISTANSSIDKQSASIDAQILQIDDKIADNNITSPISGVVLSKYAEQGEYTTPGKALLKVANISDMKLRAYVTAEQVTTLKLGQKVTVFADSGTDERKAYEGTITWISDKAEFTPKTIQTRAERANLVYAIKISVTNDGLIKRGMYGDVKF